MTEQQKEKVKYQQKWLYGSWFAISTLLIILALFKGIINFWSGVSNLTFYVIVAVMILFSFWFVNLWKSRFIEDQDDPNNSINPYRSVFFNSINAISIILMLMGFFGAFMIYSDPNGNIYQAIALVITVIWATIFIRYFGWAIYFYNINYGYTDKDWAKIFNARKRKEAGELVDDEELKGPSYNPYRSQTFGLPAGTVRGMIAFTLLFGALALVVVSMGYDFEIEENTFIRDSFEFFETAFLMMIAFYFGDRALKYLQKRWDTPETQLKRLALKKKGDLEVDEEEFVMEDQSFAEMEMAPPAASAQPADVPITNVKRNLNLASAGVDVSGKKTGLIPIIDVGHGGMDGKKYTTGNKKMYEFVKDDDEEAFTIYEGVINREIGMRLANLLKKANIPFYNLNIDDKNDMPLSTRVSKANEIHRENPHSYYLSIHSNAASNTIKGKGAGGRGFEIYTSPGQTKSDELAQIAARWYLKLFPEFNFRKDLSDNDFDKESKFYVLRKTIGPAFLVENLFYDNRDEAKYLMSKEGQDSIAYCLFKAAEEIYLGSSKPPAYA